VARIGFAILLVVVLLIVNIFVGCSPAPVSTDSDGDGWPNSQEETSGSDAQKSVKPEQVIEPEQITTPQTSEIPGPQPISPQPTVLEPHKSSIQPPIPTDNSSPKGKQSTEGQSVELQDMVLIPDTNLENAIREALGKELSEVITVAELGELTQLSANNRYITDITGIENCVNLTSLYLGLNRIRDISPLANITSITSLHLGGNQISDVSPLANLIKLNYLYLGENQIGDISYLVENSGLGSGDEVWLANKQLAYPDNLERGMENIRQLEERGVTVVLLTGKILYNLKSIVNFTEALPDFWVRNEDTGKSFSIDPIYDSVTGHYTIPNIPLGMYGVYVRFDTVHPFDGHFVYPGNFDGWNSPIGVSEEEGAIGTPLQVQRIIHLTSPVDNKGEIDPICDPKPTHTAQGFQVTWDPIAEATSYKVTINKYQEPFKYLEQVMKINTSDTVIVPSLPPNDDNQFYLLSVLRPQRIIQSTLSVREMSVLRPAKVTLTGAGFLGRTKTPVFDGSRR
jgi:Leucine-rich repeat (LRR) protein